VMGHPSNRRLFARLWRDGLDHADPQSDDLG
jgi:hypothetical protein